MNLNLCLSVWFCIWCILAVRKEKKTRTKYYTLNVCLQRKIVSFVFPRVSIKTNYFPRKQTLSVLLYSNERSIKNINTTIVFHAKKIKNFIVETSLISKETYLNCFSSIYSCLLCIFLSFTFFVLTKTWKALDFKFACIASILFILCQRAGNNSISSLDYVTKESCEICARRSSVQLPA